MDEIDLPEPVIHVVQSYLNSKDSARTTILSKSWRSAWLTRPNLDFDHADFRLSNYGYNLNPIYPIFNPKFLEFAERTFQRYENSNLIIDSFRLSMKHLSGVATGLVCRALKLRPTRLTLEFGASYAFHIPDEVFRYEILLSLSDRCRINLNRDEVCCSSLRFLSFNRIRIKRPDTMFRIISSCPLIEKLSLCYVYGDGGESVGDDDGMLMTITSPLHRLTSLVLKHVDFDTTFFLDDVSSKFPSLKDLTLHINNDREEILISSPTLERLDFNIEEYYVSGYTVKLDVPSINKLTFACSNLPDELSIASNSSGCESCVSVTRVKFLDASWVYKLSNFIDKFKFSRISQLSLHVYYYIGVLHPEAGDIRGLSMPEIENLTILVHEYMINQNCFALFDGLFHMCRPKVINIRSVHTYRTNIINFLVKRLLGARDGKVPTPNQYYWMYGLNEYIKEARAQVLNATGSTKWRDVTLDSLLDENSTTIKNNLDFRFHLNWKE